MNSWMLSLKQGGESMLENELDASNFLYNGEVYNKEFELILCKITSCYFMLKKDEKEVPLNNENGIRDIIVNNYINNPEIKKSLNLNYFVLPEVPESNSTGRTDIRIFSPNTFYNQDEYYIIECKRLDQKARRGTSGLNYEYINNGINRFITGKYSSHYKINAMLGFVIDSLDIHNNIEDINYLLKNNFTQIATTSFLQKENFIDNFEFHYSSTHLTNDKQDLKLYHLMFSFV
ncbi:MAG: hypothetical protein JEZ09_02315 [Salinivirgaceae bacterium]|nr:hypothetical protein [Salinivirgaceae bacterium]